MSEGTTEIAEERDSQSEHIGLEGDVVVEEPHRHVHQITSIQLRTQKDYQY